VNGRIELGEDLQDYLDDRLDEHRKAEIDASLRGNPDAAEYVEKLKRQNESLQQLGAAILDEPVPDRLRAVVRRGVSSAVAAPKRRTRHPFLQAAAAAVIFICGGGGGWWLHSAMNPLPTPVQTLLQNSSYAFTFYGSDDGFPLGFSPEQSKELEDWIQKLFGKTVSYPDLSSNNYQFAGGNILPGAEGQTVFFLYSRSEGGRVSIIAWASESEPSEALTVAEVGDIAASYWYSGSFGYAVLGNRSDDGLGEIADAVFKFYGKDHKKG